MSLFSKKQVKQKTEYSSNKYYFTQRKNAPNYFDGRTTVVDSEMQPIIVLEYGNKGFDEFRIGPAFIWFSDSSGDHYFAPLIDAKQDRLIKGAVEIFGLEDVLDKRPETQYLRVINSQKEFDDFDTAYKLWLAQ